METNKKKNGLLYIEEHLSCRNYMTTIETGFKYLELDKGTEIKENNVYKNCLLFFLEGEFTINCNQYRNRLFHMGEMLLIPQSSQLKITTETDVKLLSLFFDTFGTNCDKLTLQSLSDICKKITYNFEPVKIKYPLTSFLDILIHCIRNKMNCFHLHDLMQKEFFLLLRGFYDKEKIAVLFFPIVGKDMDFKSFIIQNYDKVNDVEQLILLSNLGRSSFFVKFSKVFGMTAKQWILKQKDQRILTKLTEPGINIKNVIEELGFDSQAYFNRYCRKHFGCTPKELIKRCQNDY